MKPLLILALAIVASSCRTPSPVTARTTTETPHHTKEVVNRQTQPSSGSSTPPNIVASSLDIPDVWRQCSLNNECVLYEMPTCCSCPHNPMVAHNRAYASQVSAHHPGRGHGVESCQHVSCLAVECGLPPLYESQCLNGTCTILSRPRSPLEVCGDGQDNDGDGDVDCDDEDCRIGIGSPCSP